MSVAINSTRKAVEISWDPEAYPESPEVQPPDGFPSHPIYLPPYVDNSPPTDQPKPEHPIFLPPYIDNSLPGDQPHPDNTLPGDQPHPDNTLPGDQPHPDNTLPGDLPGGGEGGGEGGGAFPGDPGYNPPPGGAVPTPQHEAALAVQVFAQGQEGDWSNTAVMPNDGLAVLTFPQGFSGASYVEVRDLFGNLVDCGTITVEAN